MFFYLSFITLFALAIFLFSFREDFDSPAKRGLRGGLFLTLGICTGIPILHIIIMGQGLTGHIPNPTLINWFLGGFAYIFGCIIYLNRLPEKKWPGKFCIWVSLTLNLF